MSRDLGIHFFIPLFIAASMAGCSIIEIEGDEGVEIRHGFGIVNIEIMPGGDGLRRLRAPGRLETLPTLVTLPMLATRTLHESRQPQAKKMSLGGPNSQDYLRVTAI